MTASDTLWRPFCGNGPLYAMETIASCRPEIRTVCIGAPSTYHCAVTVALCAKRTRAIAWGTDCDACSAICVEPFGQLSAMPAMGYPAGAFGGDVLDGVGVGSGGGGAVGAGVEGAATVTVAVSLCKIAAVAAGAVSVT